MNSADNRDDRVWLKLLNFIFPDERTLTQKEVRAELRNAGIDMRPVKARLRLALRSYAVTGKARQVLEAVPGIPADAMAKMREVQAFFGKLVYARLREFITARLSGRQRAAYLRRLQTVASEEDLRSLLEDLSRLEPFSDGADGAE